MIQGHRAASCLPESKTIYKDTSIELVSFRVQFLCCLFCLSCSYSSVASVSARHLALSPAPASSRRLSPSSLSAVSSIAKHAQGTGTRPAAPPSSSDARGTAEETPCLSEPRQDLQMPRAPQGHRAKQPALQGTAEKSTSTRLRVHIHLRAPAGPHSAPSPSESSFISEPQQEHIVQHRQATNHRRAS